ncbi:hypothetical protein BX616_010826, partial [Lobosporangium transversale]
VFNVGNRRRIASKGDNKNGTSHSHAFFDPKNSTAKTIRDELALESLEELIAWLKLGGRVGIHDATNSSRERRKMLLRRLEAEPNCRVLFIESICTDPVVLAHNITMKLSSPDYKGMDEKQARDDFRKRLENYERAYQTLDEEDEEDGIQYCKLINVGKKRRENEVSRRLEAEAGMAISNPRERTVAVWTSMLTRTKETVEEFDPKEYDIKHMRFLNEIYAGICEGLSYNQIEQLYPEEFESRRINKLFYRYPGMGGESYLDVVQRLNPLIIELERMTSDLLIVTHRVVMRILLGYLMDIDRSKMPEMEVPLHTLYCVEPKPHGTVVRKFKWVEELDWFFEEPTADK